MSVLAFQFIFYQTKDYTGLGDFEHNSRASAFEKYGEKHVVCAIHASYSMIFIPTPTWRYHSGKNHSNIRKSSEVLQNYKHFVQNLEDPLNQNDTVNQNDHLNLN